MSEELKSGAEPLTSLHGQGSADARNQRHASRRSSRRVRVLAPEVLQAKPAPGQVRAVDAAAFLQRYPRPMSWLKLQDLLYLALAWHLVWDEELLFSEPVTVTADGVSIGPIEELLAGQFEVSGSHLRMGRPERLGESRQRTLAGMLDFYGTLSHFRLAEQIRQDPAWQKASKTGPGTAIDPALLYRHYRSI